MTEEQSDSELPPPLTEYAAEESAVVGRSLGGRYVIDKLLGVGGMGLVVRARHVYLDRFVAVKLLHPQLLVVREVRERFLREARTASALKDPRVVEITDFGVTPEGLHYLVMEFLQGCDLQAYTRSRGVLDVRTALTAAAQVCEALVRIHAAGFVHRDLKPENIWVMAGDELQIKVLDFGIAGIMADGQDESARLTKTGRTVGTPHYMAPEQGRGGEVDGRADLYALGCILHEIVTGKPAFEGDSPLDGPAHRAGCGYLAGDRCRRPDHRHRAAAHRWRRRHPGEGGGPVRRLIPVVLALGIGGCTAIFDSDEVAFPAGTTFIPTTCIWEFHIEGEGALSKCLRMCDSLEVELYSSPADAGTIPEWEISAPDAITITPDPIEGVHVFPTVELEETCGPHIAALAARIEVGAVTVNFADFVGDDSGVQIVLDNGEYSDEYDVDLQLRLTRDEASCAEISKCEL